jgi:tight adherence protein C
MALAILTFLTAFLIIAIVAGLKASGSSTLRRLSKAVAPPAVINILADKPVETPGDKVARIVEPFQRVLPKSSQEVSVVQQRLARAGYRDKKCVNVFYGAKVLCPLLFCVLITVTGVSSAIGPFSWLMAAGFGFLVPDFWLGNRIKARQTILRLGLPDALDLIIICMEAGLGLDRAIQRAGEEMRVSLPEMAEELEVRALEQKAGRSRSDAWKNLGERTGVESIRALAAILTQADKFGTSVGKALRGHSEALRVRRRQDAEEQAARTTVKLIFPLVLFIFPALFVVTLGPSMIIIVEEMQNFFN